MCRSQRIYATSSETLDLTSRGPATSEIRESRLLWIIYKKRQDILDKIEMFLYSITNQPIRKSNYIR